jgi:3-(3-hydroxy-phenyl)propionate hydroxylase
VSQNQYDVIIVGFGPVGQVAANLLGRDRARVAVFETATSVYNLPRAAHFDAEIMRIFQSIGLSEAVGPAIAPILGMHFLDATGNKLFGFDAPDGPTANGWPAGFMFYQPDLESALQEGARRYQSVEIFPGHEVTKISKSPAGVGVVVRELASGNSRTVTADYLWAVTARAASRARRSWPNSRISRTTSRGLSSTPCSSGTWTFLLLRSRSATRRGRPP